MKKYHFIGIGGISMSALALIIKKEGNIVSGSDIQKSQITQHLENEGIIINYSHKVQNIECADVVIYNSAISDSNKELEFARKNNKTILSRGELLRKISDSYENVISISGAHGKTTTSAMITEVFIHAGLNPTAHLGGVLKSINSNFIVGDKKYFITEACEYKDNFLLLKSACGVILNIEPEHLDYFKTKENLFKSFQNFAKNCDKLVVNSNLDVNHKNPIYYNKKEYIARNIKQTGNGEFSFVCYYDKKRLFKIKMNIVGLYNVENALACIAVCCQYGIDKRIIKHALENFSGVKRRFEKKSISPLVVHDYAHHPSEIKSVISATKNAIKGRLFVVFQPHTYSRTKSLMEDFVNCFDLCNKLVILKTYSARETYMASGSAKQLYLNILKRQKVNFESNTIQYINHDNIIKHKINRTNSNQNISSEVKRFRIMNRKMINFLTFGEIEYFENFDCCYEYLKANTKKTDTILILGAGDVEKLANKFEK